MSASGDGSKLPSSHDQLDFITVVGIAALVYTGSVFLHEVIGHGGACLAVGGRILSIGAYYLDCDTKGLSEWASRVVAAAGNTANALLAFLAWFLMRRALPERTNQFLFWWLLFTVNALAWSGYYLFSGVMNIGDWGSSRDGVLFGVGRLWAWRIGLSVIGAGLYVFNAWLAARSLGQCFGGTSRRIGLGFRWTITAYLTGAAISILTGLLNPLGFVIVLMSAAASSLGGTSGLLWLPSWMERNSREPELKITRNWTWISAGALVAILYAVFLGPTIRLH